jgi:formylglycine-generating enzyme required for sulfatase activity
MKKGVLIGIMIAAVLALFYGCEFLAGPDTPFGGGNLVISAGTGGARAAYTDEEINSFRYVFTFMGPGGDEFSRELSPGAGTLTVSVALGQWTIGAAAYNGANELTGTGSVTVTVKAGSNPVKVPMTATDYVFTTPALYRSMVSLAGGTITGSGSDGAFVSGRTVTLSAFKIAQYETTWELWKEVYDWAGSHGYSIANPGYQGHEAAGTSPGTGTTNESLGWTAEQKKRRPVTYINWRDAIVWCNAYSEMSGKEPVYCYSGSVIKDAGNYTACDSAVMDTARNGYRLPTEAEWEYAARGGDQTDTTQWAYTYAGTSTAGTGAGELGDYAWSYENSEYLGTSDPAYGAHPAGTKNPNKTTGGLYDMSGNVYEWCWDWYSDSVGTTTPITGPASGSYRVFRGGGWDGVATICAVVRRDTNTPNSRYPSIGFRVVCP